MPRRVDYDNSKEKWNFYFPIGLKVEMQKKLLDLGLQGKQSALLRALVNMFVNNELPIDRVKELIEDETYVTSSGKVSKL